MLPIRDEKKRGPQSSKRLREFLLRFDFVQILSMLALLVVGVFFIYGTGRQIGTSLALSFWKRQIVWIVIGLGLWAFFAYFDYRVLSLWAWLFYLFSVAGLIFVLIWGVRIYGARRWLDLGLTRVQPSEFAKPALLIMIAWVLSMRKFNVNKLRGLATVLAVCGLPFILILLEPDLGSALVLAPLTAVLLFAAGLRWRYIILIGLACLIAIPCVYPFLSDYQKERIKVFLDPGRDPRNRGWNSLQSELAVGSGGLNGKGFMCGTQNALGFLPQTVSNTDFIFSVIAEETGFVGAATLLLLYAGLLYSAVRTAIVARDDFGSYLAIGVAAILFTHIYINIGMSVRLMPITGLPLPLISYGGSFIVNTLVYLGILQSIYSKREVDVSEMSAV